MRQTMEAAGHTAALYMNELDERIHAADIYMSNDADENTHTFKLRDDLSDEEFMKVASFYWQELDPPGKKLYGGRCLFFLCIGSGYANVAVKGDFNSLRSVLNDYIKTQSRLRVEQPRNFVRNGPVRKSEVLSGQFICSDMVHPIIVMVP